MNGLWTRLAFVVFAVLFAMCHGEELPENQENTTPTMSHIASSVVPSSSAIAGYETHVTKRDSDVSPATKLQDLDLFLCEGQRQNIVCQVDTFIYIASASYGHNETNVAARLKCAIITGKQWHESGSTSCYHVNSTDILANKCDGLSQCEISATDEDFDDPCPRTTKYLEVSYSCRSDRQTESFTTTPSTTQIRPESLSTGKVLLEDAMEPAMNTNSLDSFATTGLPERITEGFTTTPSITRNRSEPFSSDAYVLKAATESSMGTNSRDRFSTTGRPERLTEGFAATRSATQTRSGSVATDTVVRTETKKPAMSTSPQNDEFSRTGLPERLTKGFTTTSSITKIRFESLSTDTGVSKDVTEPAISTNSLHNMATTFTPEQLTEGFSATPFLTRKRSEYLSTDRVTLEDITEPRMSTNGVDTFATTGRLDIYLILCEGQRQTIACPQDSLIEIVSASYGYNGSSTSAREKCDPTAWWWERGDDNTRCHEPNSKDLLINACGGRSECEISASNHFFGDPCNGIQKILEVFYNCRVGPSEEIFPTRSMTVTQNQSRTSATTSQYSSDAVTSHGLLSVGIISTFPVTLNVSKTPSKDTDTIKNVTEFVVSTSTHDESKATTSEQRSDRFPSTEAISRHHSEPMIVKNTTDALELRTSRVSSTPTTPSEFVLILCEDYKQIITCPQQTVIEIVNASFGYSGSSTSSRDKCDPTAWWWERGDDSTRCHQPNSKDIFINACEGRSECEVSASIDFFGDPCYGIQKILEVFYNCREESPEINATTTQILTNGESSDALNVLEASTSSNHVFETRMTTSRFSDVTSENTSQAQNTGVTRGSSLDTRTHSVGPVNDRDISKGAHSTSDVTITRQIAATTPNASKGSNRKWVSKYSSLPLIIALVLGLLIVVVLVGGILWWRRSKTGKFKLGNGVWSTSQPSQHPMETLNNTYTSFERNGTNQATSTP